MEHRGGGRGSFCPGVIHGRRVRRYHLERSEVGLVSVFHVRMTPGRWTLPEQPLTPPRLSGPGQTLWGPRVSSPPPSLFTSTLFLLLDEGSLALWFLPSVSSPSRAAQEEDGPSPTSG